MKLAPKIPIAMHLHLAVLFYRVSKESIFYNVYIQQAYDTYCYTE